jgi:very-short-patch-repair endonuclease
MENFARQVRERRGTVLSPLLDIDKNVEIKCKKGHVFSMIPSDKDWLWCKKCPPPSIGEQKIEEYFRKRSIEFRPEYPITLPKRQKFYFDFLVKKHRLLVEFDGKQHFEEVAFFRKGLEEQRRIDLVKNRWAVVNKYHLIRIPYFQINDIDSILDAAIEEIDVPDCDFLLTPCEDYYVEK